MVMSHDKGAGCIIVTLCCAWTLLNDLYACLLISVYLVGHGGRCPPSLPKLRQCVRRAQAFLIDLQVLSQRQLRQSILNSGVFTSNLGSRCLDGANAVERTLRHVMIWPEKTRRRLHGLVQERVASGMDSGSDHLH